MSENAGSQPAAPDKGPTGPPEKKSQRDDIGLSPGNGVLHQFLTFIKDMSDGNPTQRRIAIGISIAVGIALLAVVTVTVIVALSAHGTLAWLGYASTGTAVVSTVAAAKRIRRPKSGE